MTSEEYILVVDDETETRDLIALNLQKDRYPVKTAFNGQHARTILAKHPFALVITDLMMPDLSGFELLAEVKAQHPSAEVILMTAFGSIESTITALQKGAHDYLVKPFSMNELSLSVQRALNYRRLKLEKAELLDSLKQRNNELLRLLEASNRLTHVSLQPDHLFDEIIEIAQQQLGLTIAITLLSEKRGEFLLTKISTKFQPNWRQILAKLPLTEAHLRALIADAPNLSQSYLFETTKSLSKIGVSARETALPQEPLLAAPLQTREGRLIGVLWVADIGQSPPVTVIQRVEIFANQVVGILQQASLFSRQNRQVHVRNTLVEAGQRIATVLDQSEVVHTVLEAVLKINPQAELVIIYYRSNPETELKSVGLNSNHVTINDFAVDTSLIAEVLNNKQTIYQPNWQDKLHQTDKSLIIEPLVLGRVSFGALAVISHQPVAFDEDHQKILTMLASQATIALQNARLYAEARRVDELEALQEAGQLITRTLNLQETLTTTMAISRSLTGALISNIYLYTPDHQQIDSVVTLNEDLLLSDADRRRSSEIAREVLESRRPSLIVEPQNVSTNGTFEEKEVNTLTIQTWLTVPLLTNKAPLGVLELGSKQPKAFTTDDMRLMQIIASQAATAIENARLYEESQRRLQQTEALSTISQSISQTLDLHQVLKLVVHSAAKTIPVATHSILYLRDPASEIFVPEAYVNLQDGILPPELEVIRNKAIVEATRKNATIQIHWENEEHNPWVLLVAPLKVNESVIGAISVESPHSDIFVPGDEILLNTFANHASIAIQNANLFRELSFAYLDLSNKQEEILRNHNTLQALFDSITDGLYIVDRDLKIVAVNKAETERFARIANAMIGQSCDTSFWGEATSVVTKLLLNTFETGEEKNWESNLDVTERGPFTNRDVRTYPIFNASDEVNQVIIFAQDVSEKRRLQASLFRSANLAAVGQLASGIAHQINNPLTVILANSQIMQMERDPDMPDYSMITHIIESSTQIRKIVQNLLDFSTQDSYDWFETDLQETIEDALTLTTHALRKSDINLTKRIEQLPVIIASKSHLKLLWMNLLLNARDAISSIDGEGGKIKISAAQIGSDQVQIQIWDNGIGIPYEHRDRLFHPFFTTKATNKNMGLGLYTCRAIVEAHQGQIELESNPEGSNTLVIVNLPIRRKLHLSSDTTNG